MSRLLNQPLSDAVYLGLRRSLVTLAQGIARA
jgi:hypothetical protein